jgi:predicted ribosomally synthesized peptide with SipW-like signal peptide
MKKILGLTITFLLIASMVTGGVLAYFSDTEVSSSNTLTAGTLDLSPTTSGTGPAGKYTVTAGGDQINGNVVFSKLLPGDSGNITWVLVNKGSLSGTLALSSTVSFVKGSSNEIKTAAGDNGSDSNGYLDEYVGVKLQRGIGTDQASASANLTYLLGSASSYVPMSGLQSALNSAGCAMAASGGSNTVVYCFAWEIGSLFGSVNPDIIQSDFGSHIGEDR